MTAAEKLERATRFSWPGGIRIERTLYRGPYTVMLGEQCWHTLLGWKFPPNPLAWPDVYQHFREHTEFQTLDEAFAIVEKLLQGQE